jgi:hypothetical protein
LIIVMTPFAEGDSAADRLPDAAEMLVDVAEEGALDHLLGAHGGHPREHSAGLRELGIGPRTAAPAAAAPFLWSAIVSGFVQPANSLACWAFISSSIWGVKCGSAGPAAIVLMMWVTGS